MRNIHRSLSTFHFTRSLKCRTKEKTKEDGSFSVFDDKRSTFHYLITKEAQNIVSTDAFTNLVKIIKSKKKS